MYTNKEQIFRNIIKEMGPRLTPLQNNLLLNTLATVFEKIEIIPINNALSTEVDENEEIIKSYAICKSLNGLSVSSQKAYLYTIKRFLLFTNNAPILRTETNTIRCFLIDLERKGNTKGTQDGVRRSLNTFFQWLCDEDYIEKNPCKRIKRIKEPVRIKRYFSEMEMEQLRDSCKSKRELAIMDLLLSTGLRISECANLQIKDLNDIENPEYIKVIGKGNKERICYLSIKAKKHLLEYLYERKNSEIQSDFLIAPEKKPYNKKLCKEALGKIVKQIGKRCGVNDIHVHGIRAYFATNLSDHGVEPQIIQNLMGHDSFSTTVRYYCKKNTDAAQKAVLAYI